MHGILLEEGKKLNAMMAIWANGFASGTPSSMGRLVWFLANVSDKRNREMDISIPPQVFCL
jgi:hypothetical protein